MVDTQLHPLEGKDRNAYSSGRVKETRVKETTFREWVVANQIGILPQSPPKRRRRSITNSTMATGISMTFLAMLLALHNLYPSLRPYTAPFFQLSYYNESTKSYVQGWNDIYFVFNAAVALTGIRAITIEWVIQPIARAAGLKRKNAVRIAEQGWMAMYYGFIWAVGLVSGLLAL